MVRRLNIDGDGQGDLAGHGGEHRAVFVYQIESYRYWEEQLGRHDFTYGQFGENFTVEGLPDDEVCIGDRYRIGDVVFEVTQPRVTCYRVGVRLDEPQMPSLLVAHHRPGFYFRVLQEGEVQAGDEITKLTTGPEAMTVAEMDGLLYLPRHPRRSLARALRIPALSDGWRESFQTLLDQDPDSGNQGLNPAAGARPAWTGFRPFRVAGIDRESRERDLDPPRPPSEPDAPPGPARPVRDRSAPARRRVRPTAAELLALGSSRGRRLPDQRQAGGARCGQRLPARRAPGGRHPRDRGSDEARSCSGRAISPWSWPVRGSARRRCSPCCTPWPKHDRRRQVWWLHGARSRADHSFAARGRRPARRAPDAHRLVCYSDPGPDDRAGIDFDVRGRLTGPGPRRRGGARPTATFYLCGPDAVHARPRRRAGRSGRHTGPDQHGGLRAERSDHPGHRRRHRRRPPHPPEGPPGPGPEISFSRSNLTVAWDPAFLSLLELAEACDVPVRWSCRSGVCHTCETGLVSGSVSYRPDPIEAPGPGNAYLCCSRPQTDVVLDL